MRVLRTFFFVRVMFIELLAGAVVERRVELLYPGRRDESRRGAGGARDEGSRSDQDSRSLQIVSQMQARGDESGERHQFNYL